MKEKGDTAGHYLTDESDVGNCKNPVKLMN